MIRRQVVAVVCSVVLSTGAVASSGNAQVGARRRPDWGTDLAFVAHEVPRRHGAPWHAITRDDFDRAVAALRVRIDSLPSHKAALELARIVALIQDGHTELQLFDGPNAFHRLPVVFYRFADTLRVLAALPEYKGLLGARVQRFGSVPTHEMLARIEPHLAHDNPMEFLHQAPTTLASPEVLSALGATARPDSASLTFELESGEIVTRVLPGVSDLSGVVTRLAAANVVPPWSAARRGQTYWFELRPNESLAYFRLDQSADQRGAPSIASVAQQFFARVDEKQPRFVVIDVRANNGGNNARNAALVRGIEARSVYRQSGALYVITGRTTFSAGTELVRDLKRVAAPIVIGERSRGDPRVVVNREEIRLPSSGFRVDYSQRWELREQGGERFIPVDIDAPPTFAAYAAGKDAAMDAILRHIRANAQ